MKFFPLHRSMLVVAVLALHGTTILASVVSSWVESEFDKAESDFYGLVANEVTKELATVDGVLAQFSMGYSRTPPISTSLKTSHLQSELTVALYDGSGDYQQPLQFDFAKSQYTDRWDKAWFGVALDNFDAEFEVEVDLSADANGDYTLSLLQIGATYYGVAVDVDFQLYMTAEAAASMSFTTGLEITMKKPMGIMIPALNPILDLSQSKGINIDADNFRLKPIFNATVPNLEFSAMLALRTVFSVTVESVNVGNLTLDLPAFEFNANTVTNKMANCKTPPPDTPSDKIYAELIQMGGSIDAILSYEVFDGSESGVIDKWTMWNGFHECYAFLPGVGTLGKVPPTSRDSILSAKPVTTCTTGGKTTIGVPVQPLDRGEKAAIAVGTFIGASLIAALAFFGGRASQRRSIKKHGIATARNSQHAGYGKVVDRSHYGEPNDERSTSDMTFLQTDGDAGLWPGDTGLQTPSTYNTWSKRKPLPYLALNGVDIPASADLALDGDIGTSTAEQTEPGHARDSPAS